MNDLRQKLDALDDEISQGLTRLEETLGQLALGVPLQLVGGARYDKFKGSWRLMLDDRPLKDCSRQERAATVEMLCPTLIETIEGHLQAYVTHRQIAVRLLCETVAELRLRVP